MKSDRIYEEFEYYNQLYNDIITNKYNIQYTKSQLANLDNKINVLYFRYMKALQEEKDTTNIVNYSTLIFCLLMDILAIIGILVILLYYG